MISKHRYGAPARRSGETMTDQPAARQTGGELAKRLHGWAKAEYVDGDSGLVKVLCEAADYIERKQARIAELGAENERLITQHATAIIQRGQRIVELEKALEPFAKAYDLTKRGTWVLRYHEADGKYVIAVTNDLSHARAVLSGERNDG